ARFSCILEKRHAYPEMAPLSLSDCYPERWRAPAVLARSSVFCAKCAKRILHKTHSIFARRSRASTRREMAKALGIRYALKLSSHPLVGILPQRSPFWESDML